MGFVFLFQNQPFPINAKFLSESQLFSTFHGVCLFFGLKPLAADRFLPAAVIGPVDIPP
jgi:hypothetical protein